jgi:hypothetical protein
MASTNLLQFNPAQMNQENDAAYAADPVRTGGAVNGSNFPSPTGNKLFYQLSTFVAAFGAMLAAKGYDNSDADISALQDVLANVKTAADFRAPLVVLSYAATPAYDAEANDGFQMQLTGNVTGPTISGQSAGQVIRFAFQQDATGGRTVAWPAGVVGGPTINPSPNAWSVIDFLVTNDLALRLIGTFSTSTTTDQTGSRGFGVTYQNTSSRPLFVSGWGTTHGSSTGELDAAVGPVTASITVFKNKNTASVEGAPAGFGFMVPPGYFYQVTAAGDVYTLGGWTETTL